MSHGALGQEPDLRDRRDEAIVRLLTEAGMPPDEVSAVRPVGTARPREAILLALRVRRVPRRGAGRARPPRLRLRGQTPYIRLILR